jgi:hypothetical protein
VGQSQRWPTSGGHLIASVRDRESAKMMDVLGIALIVCGLALIFATLIQLLFRWGEQPASSDEAIKPFVPRPWVDPHPDEAPKDRDES